MVEFVHPSEIARETLRRLALQRVQPTPDNYRALYNEIAGKPQQSEDFPECSFRGIANALPRSTKEQLRVVRQIDAAIAGRSWVMLKSAMVEMFASVGSTPPAWGSLIRELLRQLDRGHAGLTNAQKREALVHVLAASSADPDQLFLRMQSLLGSWARAPTARQEILSAEHEAMDTATANSNPSVQRARPAPLATCGSLTEGCLRRPIARFIEEGICALPLSDPQTAKDAAALAAEIRAPNPALTVTDFEEQSSEIILGLTRAAKEQAERALTSQRLFGLVIENIEVFNTDDDWPRIDVEEISTQLSSGLDTTHLEAIEHRLRNLFASHGALKHSIREARDQIKLMLAGFLEHLATLAESTGEYESKLGECSHRISMARDMNELGDAVAEVLRETRDVQTKFVRSHEDMTTTKTRVEDADREIRRLKQELAVSNNLVCHDHLTGTFNRRGMDEQFERELARSKRHGSPLCVALLDIDNFKRLNDAHGHRAGDDALVHLANVVRNTLRPNDILARYGGEEFLILLPDTNLHDAVTALTRLQRELTKRFFLTNNERILITFSAGVAQWAVNQSREDTIARADAAMYDAKRTGKNKVISAE